MNSNNPVVLFDGVCNLCNSAVQFLLRQDKKKILRFASLQSAAGQQLLQQYGLPQHDFQSFMFIENGKAYQQSTAALKLLSYLSWHWQWGKALWIFPKSLRDFAYRVIAKNRYRWFGKRESCMVPSPDLQQRFLP